MNTASKRSTPPSVPPPIPATRRETTRLRLFIATLVLALIPTAMATGTASAHGYTQNVYAPKNVSGYAEGWAQIVQDSCGQDINMGCWTYMKIEKWSWLGNSWVGGGWVTGTGWQTVKAELPDGCGYYRTTVDSYNDVIGPISVDLGVRSISAGIGGQKVYRYSKSQFSDWAILCS